MHQRTSRGEYATRSSAGDTATLTPLRRHADSCRDALSLTVPVRQQLLRPRAEPLDDLAHRCDAGDHPNTLTRVHRGGSAIVGGDRGGEFALGIGVLGQRVLMTAPARDAGVA